MEGLIRRTEAVEETVNSLGAVLTRLEGRCKDASTKRARRPKSNQSGVNSNAVVVQATNDTSIWSKRSAVDVGYWKDPFIQYFTSFRTRFGGRPPRRTAVINQGYYIRTKAIDEAVCNWLHLLADPGQVVVLGAGFDTTFFRFQHELVRRKCRFVEIDFPGVCIRKAEIIKNTNVLRDAVGLVSDTSRENKPNVVEDTAPLFDQRQKKMDSDSQVDPKTVLRTQLYTLLGCDITDRSRLEQLLLEAQVSTKIPTLVISECVLAYVPTKQADGCLRWIASFFEDATLVNYEQVHPDDGFGGVMLKHFRKNGSPLHAVSTYPSPVAQSERLAALGWKFDNCDSMDLLDYYNFCISRDEHARVLALEVFDEFEEFFLKCSHYVISTASNSQRSGRFCKLNHLFKPIRTTASTTNDHGLKISATWQPPIDADFKRWSHRTVQLSNHIVCFGGFGPVAGRQKRTNDLNIFEWDGVEQIVHQKDWGVLDGEPPSARLDCSIVCTEPEEWSLASEQLLIVFGGRQAPQKPLDDLHVFNVSLGKWIHVDFNCDSAANTPSPRWRHTSSVVQIKRGHVETTTTSLTHAMLVIGGRNTSSVVDDQGCIPALVLDERGWQHWHWETVSITSGSLSNRHSHAVTSHELGLIVFGGMDGSGSVLNDVNVVSFVQDAAHVRLLQPTPPLPYRFSHDIACIGDLVISVGGLGLRYVPIESQIMILNLTTLCWRYIIPDLNSPLRESIWIRHTIEVIGDSIFIIGGGGNCFSFGAHYNQGIDRFVLNLEAIPAQSA